MRSSSSALPAFPRLQGHLHADAAVIGGGMAGILTAFSLHRAGLRVVLLEEDRLAGGATAGMTVRVSAQHGLFCERLIFDFGEHLARAYLAAQLHAVRQYRSLIAALGAECGLTTRDSYVYAAPNGPRLESEYACALRLGAPAELRSVKGLPFSVREALCFREQASFEPLPFLAALLPGLTVYEHSPVRDILGHTARCDGGSVTAEHIIVATRYPTLERWELFRHLRMRQEVAYLLALRGAPELDGCYLDADTRGWSLQQRGELLILGGGLHRCGENRGGSYDRLRAQAKLWFPQAQEVRTWSTQDCVTMDGVPYIGRCGMSGRIHVAAGFGRWGITNSMVAATLITAEILGNHYPYADVFSPGRFFPSASIEAMVEGALYAVRGKGRRLFTPAEREMGGILPGHGGIVVHHGKRYGVYRDERGMLFAVSPVCPHRGCALEWNDDDKTWDCPCHGSRFDYTGRRLYHPARTALKPMPLDKAEL